MTFTKVSVEYGVCDETKAVGSKMCKKCLRWLESNVKVTRNGIREMRGKCSYFIWVGEEVQLTKGQIWWMKYGT